MKAITTTEKDSIQPFPISKLKNELKCLKGSEAKLQNVLKHPESQELLPLIAPSNPILENTLNHWVDLGPLM
jgi:hypothetical protein